MLEHFKTILLITLVISSIVLSGQLWMGSSHYELADEPTSERIDYGEKAQIFEQIAPTEILLRLKGEALDEKVADVNETITSDELDILTDAEDNSRKSDIIYSFRKNTKRYSHIWNILKEDFFETLIEQNLSIEIYDKEDISDKLENDYNELILKFDFPIVEIIKENLKTSQIMNYEFNDFDKLTIYLDNSFEIIGIFLKDCKNENRLLKLELNEELGIMREKLSENLNLENDGPGETLTASELIDQIDTNEILLDLSENGKFDIDKLSKDQFSFSIEKSCEITLPEMTEYMVKKEIGYEELDKERLAKAFFHDLSFVRKIDEWDGGLIYTDGQKALRFLPGGGFEYDAPHATDLTKTTREGINIKQAIEKSGEYISLYGGWNENLLIENLNFAGENQIRDEGNFETSYRYYHEGYPIINMESIKIDFNFQGTFNYFRMLPGNIEPVNQNHEDMQENIKKTLLEPEEILLNWLKDKLSGELKGKIEDFDEEKQIDEDKQIEITVDVKDIKYAYYKQEDQNILIPVLVIESDSNKYVFDALDGGVIVEK
ncbi:two-component system activity regulator YycH [Natranaerofaba carboxydovora]|uniref:two-component system activity regulator YycH n=1 Tax=Natranaerofaba carboxydovora TaxID=2742683 RepID=UPI001F131DEE|nr:two-component system activity regulator YycH [Natranaerofaba carboxydovora]UMZ75155.1 YycH protein [Natranaerofaba carboxydovora]